MVSDVGRVSQWSIIPIPFCSPCKPCGKLASTAQAQAEEEAQGAAY